ncbi:MULTISPECIES: putative manganese-dependent inorganic diphosphatase [Caproicibacterium]|uniref:inorganic diphosphatase n=1 Tax=Caproicibacterium argilliputei TaxID=3030016 RepID=A0AA97H319_9FIRM|nr:putative manganese-dependent inorganic diphosphatase [Caproicibacterium argilliputei]WOC32747.1 putative manganese-dependent inorganic diphosphatase [Caproicibacterium argilliputei]
MPHIDMQRKVNVIGHRHPDTDSVCSAIAYTYLKNQLGGNCEARRAGQLNRETEFVLQYFGAQPPRLCTDVRPQVKDIDIRRQPGVDGDMSLKAAWELMRSVEIDTLCVTSEQKELLGVITIKDIATANMDLLDTAVLAKARTPYRNVLSALNGKLLTGSDSGVIDKGRIYIGAASSDAMEAYVHAGDIVILSNRIESQLYAVECGAGCIIICGGVTVPQTILTRAQEKGCRVITTPYLLYDVAKLLSQAAPIRHYMKTEHILKFNLNTPVEEAQKVMASVRLRYFPILDEEGLYCGVISRRNLLNVHRKRVILVDHNEKTQAVDGLDEAEILEIIDHHRLNAVETVNPIYFRNVPMGCTCTIVYQMFLENQVEIPKRIAGLLLSAILSDTLMFRSPTCTPADEAAAAALSKTAQVDIPAYAQQMFEAGGDLTGKTPEEVFLSDFKIFSSGEVRFGVGQSIYMTEKSRAAAKKLIGPYLQRVSVQQGLPLIFYMFTDVPNEFTDLMFAGTDAGEIVASAFHVQPEGQTAVLPGVMSRKKQLIPPLMAAVQERIK